MSRISDRVELEHAIAAVAKMYNLRDREAADPRIPAELRADTVEGTNAAIRNLERELAEYFVEHAAEFGIPVARRPSPLGNITTTTVPAEPVAA